MGYAVKRPDTAFSLSPSKGKRRPRQEDNAHLKWTATDKPNHPLFEDLTGQRFGIVTVTAYLGKSGRNAQWAYRCDCGADGATKSSNMKIKKSCGCLHRKNLSERQTTHGHARSGKISPEFRCWDAMIRRCTHPSHAAFKDYGGRGISVCAQWLQDFAAFYRDVGPRPSSSHSLDRHPNKDGNYEPGNVRWATQTEQQRNRSGCHWIEWDGQVITLQEACDRVNLCDGTVHGRLKRGWSMQRALSCAPGSRKESLTSAVIKDIGTERRQ